MKKVFSLVGFSFAFVTMFPKMCVTANSAEAEGFASVSIVEQVSIESERDMDFGTLISPGYAGDFVLPNTENALVSCAPNWVCNGNPASGKFKILSNSQSVNVNYSDGVLSDGLGHTLDISDC